MGNFGHIDSPICSHPNPADEQIPLAWFNNPKRATPQSNNVG